MAKTRILINHIGNKTIGIIGSRTRDSGVDQKAVREKFFEIYKEGDSIVSGGCGKGGDRFAENIAKNNGIPILIFYPKWNTLGKSAGFVRNSDVAINSDVLIACVSKDRTGGTEHTIDLFKNKCKKYDIKEMIYLI